jgi:hypothetical protein
MCDRAIFIDSELRHIRLEVEQLRLLVGMIADEPAGVRDVWHWQWHALMERLQVLHQQHCNGMLSERQANEFLAISRRLALERTLVEELGCHVPPEIGRMADAGV